ncbi:MAG: polysaccharide biosynthesis protein [Firmicutes bacterium]|nr:polysaccharide biosynthesis protein [Bacillota bacterium]
MTKKTFVKGAVILGAAGIFVKIMGFIFRIPLVNMIDSRAMAYYNPAYYVYVFFVTLATSGIPVAVSRMVSERVTLNNYEDADRVFKLSMRLMLGIGIVSFVIVFGGADIIAGLMDNPGAALPMRFVSPCLIIIPVLAAFRGLFQGMQNMRPTALSQIVEQLFRVAFGLALAYILFNSADTVLGGETKYVKGASGAVFGGTAGAIGGLAMIFIIYMVNRKSFKRKIREGNPRSSESNGSVYKEILVISIPITVGASIMPLINMIDAGLIVGRLKSTGMSTVMAEELYGGLTGMVNSMINFPQVIALAVATSMVPLIAAAYKEKDYAFAEKNIQLSIRFSMLIGMPCAVGFFVLAKPILLTLFPTQAGVIEYVSPAFMIMAVAVIFLGFVQTLTGVLQGVGKQMIPVRNMFVGVGAKLLCTWFLVPIPALGIKGAAIGTILAYMIASVLDVMAVIKYTNVHINWVSCVGRPLAAAAAMGVCVFVIYKILMLLTASVTFSTLASILLGAIIYAIMAIISKAVTRDELESMPKGHLILKIFGRFIK